MFRDEGVIERIEVRAGATCCQSWVKGAGIAESVDDDKTMAVEKTWLMLDVDGSGAG